MNTIRKYSMTLSNRMFLMILLLAFLYVTTIYLLTANHTLPWSSHEGDSHKDLKMTDQIIVILGYKLHPDGMATRVLRDRVERATNLYKELMEKGQHPLVIVSGKGKSEIGYTEAEVMLEWCTFLGVRKGDVLVDSESTNTVENAKFSSTLIKNLTGINSVYVVTSDYHISRAQYIFQTVFPVTIKLDFASSKTPENKFADSINKERLLMKSSQEDLIQKNLLETDDNGLHPIKTFTHWQMVARELENDLRDGVTWRDDDSLTVADYTDYSGIAQHGYFASQVAALFPHGRVLSIDDQSTQRPANIYRCNTTINATLISEAQRLGVVHTYQLSFEMIRWFPINASREDFENVLASLFLTAQTTFLEFPEVMHYRGREGLPYWELLNLWYGERNETEIFADVGRTHGFQVNYKVLGPTIHDNGAIHKVARVDVVGLAPHFSQSAFEAAYKCS